MLCCAPNFHAVLGSRDWSCVLTCLIFVGRETPISTEYVARYSTRTRDRQLNREFAATFDGDLQGLRRSSRQRKLLYDNMNDTMLDKNMQAIIAASEGDVDDSMIRRSTRKRHRDAIEEEEEPIDGQVTVNLEHCAMLSKVP